MGKACSDVCTYRPVWHWDLSCVDARQCVSFKLQSSGPTVQPSLLFSSVFYNIVSFFYCNA